MPAFGFYPLNESADFADGVMVGMIFMRVCELPHRYACSIPERIEEQIRVLMTNMGYGITFRKSLKHDMVGLKFKRLRPKRQAIRASDN